MKHANSRLRDTAKWITQPQSISTIGFSTVRSKIFSMGGGNGASKGSESEEQADCSEEGDHDSGEFAANDQALKEMLSALIQEANFLVVFFFQFTFDAFILDKL